MPAHKVVAHHIHGTDVEVLAFYLDMRNPLPSGLVGQSVHVLTAAQLREYATAAVLADRERVAALSDYYRELEKLSDSTPSETNSER